MRPDIPSERLLQVERLNQEPILVEIVRPSIWQLRGAPGTRGLNRYPSTALEDPYLFIIEKQNGLRYVLNPWTARDSFFT